MKFFEYIWKAVWIIIRVGITLFIYFLLGVPLAIFLGWISGIVIRWVTGSILTDGLNLLLGTSRFTPEQIPLIMSMLSTLAYMFVPKSQKNKEETK